MNGAQISLLTAGRDKPYALGLATALIATGIKIDFIGSDELDSPELRGNLQINFLNLRGEQSIDAGLLQKMARVLVYYFRLLFYATTARPKIFHILWNNKFETFDRTVLMLYYKLLGKKIVLTAHNVNIGKRDGTDSFLNRLTLKIQYRLCDHIFVHTTKMQTELVADFDVATDRTSVIPLGINNTVPVTGLTTAEARARLIIDPADKVILFFGQIAPYKGLEFLVDAFSALAKRHAACRLVIVGRPKGEKSYWDNLQQKITDCVARDRIIERIEFIPDAETELYFKAADVFVLPYKHIFQSGVLFLGYSFGLPVIAADVGSLKEEIIEGKTGFVFQPQDTADLTRVLEQFFAGALYSDLPNRRQEIRDYANERYSWRKVSAITTAVYSKLSGAKKHHCPHCAAKKT
jgi:glycosyltransferase involved in cell wall biosynthesis